MTEFIQQCLNGLSVGAIYALIALGYTMVFGILQLINFAHGEVYMLGAFIGYYLSLGLRLADHPSLGNLVFVIFAAMVGCAMIGYLIERFAYKPLRKAPRINVLITAIGVSLFLQYAGQLWFGADPKFFPPIYQGGEMMRVGRLTVNPLQFIVLGISVVLMLALQVVIFRTRLGRAMRAVSFNHEWASLMGIPTDRVISYTFMLGSALAGAAGVLVGLIYPKIDPIMGQLPGLKAFIAAVLGGIGNVVGAVVGALTLGVAESLLVGYWRPEYRDGLAFTVLILILLIKPTGLFGSKNVEKV